MGVATSTVLGEPLRLAPDDIMAIAAQYGVRFV